MAIRRALRRRFWRQESPQTLREIYDSLKTKIDQLSEDAFSLYTELESKGLTREAEEAREIAEELSNISEFILG